MLDRLDPIVAAKPKKIAVMAGINDIIAGVGVDEVAANYKRLVTALVEAGSAVFVQSTLLTADAKLNVKVNQLNNRLVAFCRELNCKYVDVNARLVPNGILMDTPDGIHLGLSAYRIWGQVIASEITP